MPFEDILRGLGRFQKRVYPKNRDLFHKLALAQRPEALFITCADSRIDPCMLTQTKPGELFIARVIGNIVPRYPKTIGGVSATIEYAVGVLEVPDVIICGHTDCGVMKGVLNPEALESLPSVHAWLDHAQPARKSAEKFQMESGAHGFLLALTERNVVEQIDNLRTHPAVASRLAQGNLQLHGWVYHIGNGLVTSYVSGLNKFLPIRSRGPEKAKVRGSKTRTRGKRKHS